ncbi:MAG: carboxypeptidase-like regulatory domain-containing protein [Flavobacteriales bacterium]|nr:carboxypeptidase-like regulatory domain-containing protein [Flavobacteriales bacterium]
MNLIHNQIRLNKRTKTIVLLSVMCVLYLINTHNCQAQNFVKGTIFDERNVPIPHAKVFVKNDPNQRTVADINGNYQLSLMPGEYFLVFSSLGFENRESYISISALDMIRKIQLFPSKIQDLESVQVSAKKSNPGRDIMKKVVSKRDQINPWNYPHKVEVYIKAREDIRRKNREEENDVEPEIDDSFDGTNPLRDTMNLLEIQIDRNYASGNKVKEFRNAYSLRGSKRNLYYTTTVKSNFNFFENVLRLDDLHENPISSPISIPGILSYKYRLVEKYVDEGRSISKIKIQARNTATSTLQGYIWVVDSLWLIEKLDLSMKKGNLLVYDYFNIQQEYDHLGDSICVLKKQVLDYGVKYKRESSICKTTAIFSNYDFQPEFDNKFFNSELAVTEKEAYEKDSSYWENERAGQLSPEEIAFIIRQDSIKDYINRKEYLDSVDKVFNKITALKVLWWGVDHRNRSKRMQWTIGSLATTIRPVYIAGPRLSPNFDLFKKWKDERTLDSYTQISYGLLNNDIKGDTWWKYKFDPFHQGKIRMSLNHDFDVIRGYDAITQIYKRENFIEATSMNTSVEYELFNGFYIDLGGEFTERRSLEGYDFLEFADDVLPNNEPSDFETYQALIADFSVSYTPKQKYMREPYRKIVLGSAWPTFNLYYERGIPDVFGSDIDHEYIQMSIDQTFKIGTIGTSSYRLSGGLFLNANNLRDPDFKFQRRSDPLWFSNPLYSFQGLDTLLRTNDMSLEAHFVHHDNGAIINKIPFMKKTRVGLVFGGGALYVKEHDYFHYEVLAGLERNFKLSRRRLRVGLYGVLSAGNKSLPRFDYKISFAILDDRSMKWNF